MYLRQARDLPERVRVPERNEHDTVVRERADGILDGDLLSSTRARGGNEGSSVFSGECAGRPLRRGGVPESL